MTTHSPPSSQNDTPTDSGMKPATMLTLLVIPVLLLSAGWIFWQQIQSTPAREVGITVPPYGIITVRVVTEPFPPTPTDLAQVTLFMQAGGGSTVTLDRVTYSYAPSGGGEPVTGEAVQVARNTYEGFMQFDSVGDWQLTIKIEKNGRINEGTITVPVKPAM